MSRGRKKRRHGPPRVKPEQCIGKARYQSSKLAAREGERFGLRPYPCLICGGWHLSSSPDR